MAASIAYKHYTRALSRWPKDNLRPECQFQDIMRRGIDKRFLPGASQSPSDAAHAVVNSPINEKRELEQANAVYSLLENRYTREYPITGSLMNPPSNPTHYADLIKELEEAPKRSWWGRLMNKWKGSVKFR